MNHSYDQIKEFINGVAIVVKDGKYGVILKGGKEIIPPKYDYISPFKDGLSRAIKDGFTIIIDLSGQEYVEINNEIRIIPENIFIIDKYGKDINKFALRIEEPYSKPSYKWGLIDANNKIILEPEYDFIYECLSGSSKACINSYDNLNRREKRRWKLIYDNCKISKEDFDTEPIVLENGDFIVFRLNPNYHYSSYNDNENEKYFSIQLSSSLDPILIHNHIRHVLNKDIYRILYYEFGHFIVQNFNKQFGAVDRDGRLVTPFFSNESELRYPHMINLPNGKEVFLPSDLEYFSGFIGKFARYKSGGKWNVIDEDGNIIIKDLPYYISIEEFKDDFFPLYRFMRERDFKGRYVLSNHFLVSPNYSEIIETNNSTAKVIIANFGEFIIDKQGHCIINNGQNKLPKEYCAGTDSINGISIVRTKDKYGLFNIEKNELIQDCNFDQIKYDEHGLYILKTISRRKEIKWREEKIIELIKYSVVNNNGELLLSGLDNVNPISDNRFLIKENDNFRLASKDSSNHFKESYIEVTNLGQERLLVRNKDKQPIVIDYNGNIITERFRDFYEDIILEGRYNENGIAKISFKEFKSYIDLDGNLLMKYENNLKKVPVGYDWCFKFDGKYFHCLYSIKDFYLFLHSPSIYRKEGLGVLVDEDRNEYLYKKGVISPSNDIGKILFTTINFTVVKKEDENNDKNLGILDINNKWLVEPTKYLRYNILNDSIITLYKYVDFKNKVKIINLENNKQTEYIYNEAELSNSSSYIIAKKLDEEYHKKKSFNEDDRYYDIVLDLEMNEIFNSEYSTVFKEIIFPNISYFIIIKHQKERYSWDDRYGMIDSKGNEILPFIYRKIEFINTNYLKVSSEGHLTGIFDFTGKEIIPVKYKNIILDSDNEFIVECN